MLEAVGVGVFTAIINPVAGLIAFGADLLLRGIAHTQCNAASQCHGYPGDFRILAVPDDVFEDYPEVKEDLRKLCGHLGLGLVRARPDGSMSWLCKPDQIEGDDDWDAGEEWLDQYVTADQMRGDLEAFLEEDDD